MGAAESKSQRCEHRAIPTCTSKYAEFRRSTELQVLRIAVQRLEQSLDAVIADRDRMALALASTSNVAALAS